MIKSIELVDFLSHSDTKLEFKDGVTIFVGDNGAGKSSIIYLENIQEKMLNH
jgi:exonuclease SbcC